MNNDLIFYDYQLDAISQLKTGSILCGGVGSGKSITALGYYLFQETKGSVRHNDLGQYEAMRRPEDLYIITTAKKRDSKEWEAECERFQLYKDPEQSHTGVRVTIDSWNNIKKYQEVSSSFFIFDEQRVVGNGSWVKSFLKITRSNNWILLSATPGDQWKDYIPIFVANGFYRNRSEFEANHCVYARFSKFPKIERYIGEHLLEQYRNEILVVMKDNRKTNRIEELVKVVYNSSLYRSVFRERWDPYEKEPIQETGKLMYLIRRVVNSDPSRITALQKIQAERKRCIVFYNFMYELELLISFCEQKKIPYAQWNGRKHEPLPTEDEWLYLVQYSAGSEGWNCITANTIVFYSQNYSYRMTEQASGRIDRINTPYQNLYYYKLRSNSTIDLAIWNCLKNKKNFNEQTFLKRRKINS